MSRLRMALSILVVASTWIGQSVFAQENPLEKALIGEWVVESCSRAGIVDKSVVGMNFAIDDMERILLTTTSGQTKSAKFVSNLHDVKAKIFRYTIETGEDNEAEGGGGPRKGICQINSKGELQIFESLSASVDYPNDFSNASTSTSKALVWKLTRKPKPK